MLHLPTAMSSIDEPSQATHSNTYRELSNRSLLTPNGHLTTTFYNQQAFQTHTLQKQLLERKALLQWLISRHNDKTKEHNVLLTKIAQINVSFRNTSNELYNII